MNANVVDEQTGQVYELHPESRLDTAAATASVVYMLVMLIFLFWQLFDVWIGQYSLANLAGYTARDRLASPTFHLIAYTIIGGGIGGIINGIRSFVVWHSERRAFGARFFWKYVTLPWLGASLALLVYALIRSGVVIFGGEISPSSGGNVQSLAAFALGGLSGYGSHDVFVWLDAQVRKAFKATPEDTVPSLIGKTREAVAQILAALDLRLGTVTEETSASDAPDGTVIRQNPSGGSAIPKDRLVHITIKKQ